MPTPSHTFIELCLQVRLDLANVEERVRLEHDPYNATERQEHPQSAAPGVGDERPFPPACDLPPELYGRGRRPRRRTRVRVGRARHQPAVPVDADHRASGQRVQFLTFSHFFAATAAAAAADGRRESPAHVTAHRPRA